jgi:hypothetical protein
MTEQELQVLYLADTDELYSIYLEEKKNEVETRYIFNGCHTHTTV